MTTAELWTPQTGKLIDQPTPTPQELVNLWIDYNNHVGHSSVRFMGDIYGVYVEPDFEPKSVVSVDLCEVLRKTAKTIHSIIGEEPKHTVQYLRGTWADPSQYEYQAGRNLLETVAAHIASHGMIPPIEGHEDIQSVLKSWSDQDVYLLANTSSLVGTEIGTIKHSLGRDYPSTFNAIAFPRNHDGNGATTKALAVEHLLRSLGIFGSEIPILHIDDAPHHIKAFTAWQNHTGLDITTFMPMYDDNGGVEQTTYCPTPLDAFMAANQTLMSKGIIS